MSPPFSSFASEPYLTVQLFPSQAKRAHSRSPDAPVARRSTRVRSATAEPVVISDSEVKTVKKSSTRPKPRAVNTKGPKKAPAAAAAPASAELPLLPPAVNSPTKDSILAPAFQMLSQSAASVYSLVAPKSVLLSNPEAATDLTTTASSIQLVSSLLNFFYSLRN